MPKRKASAAGLKSSKRATKKTRGKKRSSTKATNELTLGGRNRIMPEVYHNILEMMDTSNVVLGTGLQLFNTASYTANGLFDFTTTLGNEAVPGFNLLAPIYRNYRIKGCRITVTGVNTSTQPVYMQVSFQPAGNTNFTSWNNVRQLSSNKWSKAKLLSPKGGSDKGTLSQYCNFTEFAGPVYNTDNDWAAGTGSSGTTAGNPVQTIIGKVNVISADGVTNVIASALVINVNLTYYVQWYGLAPLPS